MINIYYNGMYAEKGGNWPHPKQLPKPDPPQKYDNEGKKIKIRANDLPLGGSYYTLPRLLTPGRAIGESRRHGDASHEVQKKSIDAIIEAAKKHGLSQRETAHVLAIAYVESGFNPDAAPGSTTAAGLGQFLRGTGWGYSLNDSNRFELKPNADALVRHYIDNRNEAIKRGNTGSELELKIYIYHHDGASKYDKNDPNSLGLKISKERIIPYTDKIERMLQGEAIALITKRPGKQNIKNSLTVGTQHATAPAPKWSFVGMFSPKVRNPTPPHSYQNSRNATATQSQAGKPPTKNQPKASLLDRIDGWLYEKFCYDDIGGS